MPPKGTAGLARSAVSGASRLPSPPASTMASTSMPTSLLGICCASGLPLRSWCLLWHQLVTPHRRDHRVVLGKPALALHRMDQLAVHAHVEGALVPGDDLDLGHLVAELLHQGLRQRQCLRLVATFRAIA